MITGMSDITPRTRACLSAFTRSRLKDIKVIVDLAAGHLRAVEIERGGRKLTPFYTAPWVDDPAIAKDETILQNLRSLSCDFFCAPFGGTDDPRSPPHGWPANSRWDQSRSARHPGGGSSRASFFRRKSSARGSSRRSRSATAIPLSTSGTSSRAGRGAISVASHAMTQFSTRGRLSFSPKAYGEAPPNPQEIRSGTRAERARLSVALRGSRQGSAEGRRNDEPLFVPNCLAPRGLRDARRGEGQEFRLGGCGPRGCRRHRAEPEEPRDFPVTFLWFSNGGRDYPPWNGRNVGVLGIEEGRAWSANGYKASIAPNPLSQSGVPTSLKLSPGGSAEVRHVIGGLPRPEGWTELGDVRPEGTALVLSSAGGDRIRLPYDPDFLASRF